MAEDQLLTLIEALMHLDETDSQVILTQAANLVTNYFHAQKTDVFLFDPHTRSLIANGRSSTAMGDQQHDLGLDHLPLTKKGRTVEVFETGRFHLEQHADQDEKELSGIRKEMGVRSVMAVPLVVNAERRGVVQVDSSSSEAFSTRDLQLLEVIAHWVGIVVHRVELVHRVQSDALQKGRRMTAEKLISIFAHDVRNYLTPLRLRLGLMRKRARREQRQADIDDMEKILNAFKRFEAIVVDLLDTARLSQNLFTLSLRSIDLPAILDDLIALLQTPHHPITLHSPKNLSVCADPDRLKQAIENVIANAIKYSSHNSPVIVQLVSDDQYYFLQITNHGPTISPNLLPHIFEPFNKGQESSGLGLGLYLAHRIAT